MQRFLIRSVLLAGVFGLLGLLPACFLGCKGQAPTPPPPPPVSIGKQITAKLMEQYSTTELDGAALLLGGKWRSIPVLKTRYLLYAEDGTHLDVDAATYATTKEGDVCQASEAEWKR
jgi:hypothetical protein